jgi:hypothetical protein
MVERSFDVEAEVLARLGALRGRLGPELGAAFDRLAARIRLFEGRRGEGYFSHPLALPVLSLPLWVPGPEGPANAEPRPTLTPPAARLAEAAAVGYLRVRVEDDWLDEGVGEPGEVMLLSGALFSRHAALLAAEVPAGSAFWQLFEEVWVGYGEAMLLERRLHRGEAPHDVEAFRRVLARSRPLILPPAAALFAAGRAAEVEPLDRFVGALAAAHQLFTDVLHAEKDRGHGNITHVLHRIGGGAPGMDAAALRAELFARGGFDRIVAEALAELERAREAAGALAMPEATRYLDRRARAMREIQTEVFQALFSPRRRSRPMP